MLRCSGLAKSFGSGEMQVEVLRDLELEVARGESVAVVGASGCGKSTLLHLLAGLDRLMRAPSRSEGVELMDWPTRNRRNCVTEAWASYTRLHHLLPEFSALENVTMPPLIGGMSVEGGK